MTKHVIKYIIKFKNKLNNQNKNTSKPKGQIDNMTETNGQKALVAWRDSHALSLRDAANLIREKAHSYDKSVKVTHTSVSEWEEGRVPRSQAVKFAMRDIIGIDDKDWLPIQ